MARLEKSTPTDSTPEQWLLAAVRARAPSDRERYARRGLAFDRIDDDTTVLLLRQLYMAHLERGELDAALEVTERMGASGVLADVVHHDRARVLAALGDGDGAVRAQRLAARAADPKRKSFQLWSLATLEHHLGDVDAALATLARAMRCATRDRALLRAHAAYIKLEAQMPVRDLHGVVDALRASKNREGYGQFLLGMIAHHMGDRRLAAVHLHAFQRRNANIDAAKALTLREELRRTRRALASLDVD